MDLLSSLTQLLYWIPTLFAVGLGNYVNQRFHNSSSQLVFIGSIIGVFISAAYLFLQYGYDWVGGDLSLIYGVLSLIGFAGRIMFLFGLLQLAKMLVLRQPDSTDYNDIIKPL